MMIKTLLAVALATVAIGASAHPTAYTHYHAADGRLVIGNQIAPRVSTTYTTDNYGRQVRVVTTVRCTEMMRNPRNNHLRCTEEETTVQQFTEGGYSNGYRPGYGDPRPVYVNPGYNNGYGYRQVDPAAAIIGGVINQIQRDERRDDRRDDHRNDRDRNDHRNDDHRDRH